MKLFNQLLNTIQSSGKQIKILFPEADDPRIQQAAIKLQQSQFAKPILVGDEDKIKQANPSLNSIEFFCLKKNLAKVNELAEILYELRKHKEIKSIEIAQEKIKNNLVLALTLLKSEYADCLVAGAQLTTADVISQSLRIIGTAQDAKLVSSLFIMEFNNSDLHGFDQLVFSDCALNIDPNPNQLSEIAKSAVHFSQKLLNTPTNVAFLSFSTDGSATHPMVEKVYQATQIFKQKNPNINCIGEVQLDTALIPHIAKSKIKSLKNSKQKINPANVLIFPDLNSGNIGYKLVQRLAGANAIGPVLQGLAQPVNDLSRGCSVEDIYSMSIISAFQTL